jgi:hypothetical protein
MGEGNIKTGRSSPWMGKTDMYGKEKAGEEEIFFHKKGKW